MYILSSSAISFQASFRNAGYSNYLEELADGSVIKAPDYSEFIPAMDRRRMSDVLKMSLTSAADCLKQAGVEQPDAIIVGTSMGCCVHIRNFLDKIISSEGSLISPTSFILSTHNTIAGQISLGLKNHGYNMTHTQNSLSFEQALIDGQLCLEEGADNVLVGGADETEASLYNMEVRLNSKINHFGEGASFFVLSNQPNATSIKLLNVESFGLTEELSEDCIRFLNSNSLNPDDVDLILFAYSNEKSLVVLNELFGGKMMVNFLRYSGVYYTSSAFAMALGVDILSHPENSKFGENIRRILVFNNMIPENLGLILLERIEN